MTSAYACARSLADEPPQSLCRQFSESILDVVHADFGPVGEDTDHVEAQGVELWFSGAEVVFGYGADGVLLAVGDGFQWIAVAGPSPEFDFDKDELLGSLVQNTMTSIVRVSRRAIGVWCRAVGVGESLASAEEVIAQWRGYTVTYPSKYKRLRAMFSRPTIRRLRATFGGSEGT